MRRLKIISMNLERDYVINRIKEIINSENNN